MSLKAGMVLTTIADPIVLESYCSNFDTHGHLGQVTVYVIPDRKTPAAAHQRCEDLRQRGMKIVFPNLDEQELYLRKYLLAGVPIDRYGDNPELLKHGAGAR